MQSAGRFCLFNQYFAMTLKFPRHLLTGLIWMISVQTLSAQLNPYYVFFNQFKEAEELFDKEKFSAAQTVIDGFIASDELERLPQDNDIRTKAVFMNAVCAYRLQRANAEGLLRAFMDQHQESTLFSAASYHLGLYFFDAKNYRDAISPLLEAYKSGTLSPEWYSETVFKLGYSYFQTGNLDQAVKYFDIAASRANPYREDAQYYRAIIYYQQANYAEAYQALKDLETSPKYGKDTKIYLAYTLYNLGRVEELNRLAEQMIFTPSNQDQSAEVYYLVANAAYEQKDYARCAEYFDRYLKARGKMSRVDYFRQGYSYYRTDRFVEAIPFLEKAVSQDVDSVSQAGSYYLGFCFLKKPDYSNARVAFKKASQTGPKLDPVIAEDALYQYAKVAFTSEAFAESQQALLELQQKYPRSPYAAEVKELLGESYLYTRDYPRSIQYFESQPITSVRARKAYQTVCYYYGLELFERRDLVQAEAYLRKAVTADADPANTMGAQFWLGETKFRQGQFADAQRQYEAYQRMNGAALNENYPSSFYGLGWCEFKAKNYTKSAQQFDKYLNLARSGGADKGMVVDALLRAGDCFFLLKNYTTAEGYYGRAEAIRYNFQDYALYQMAECKYRMDNYQASVQILDRLITNFPQADLRRNALDRIADIYRNWIGDVTKANYYSNLLIKDYPKSQMAAASYNRLAIAAYESGDEATAIKYFKKVLEDYSDSAAATVALSSLDGLVSSDEYDRILAAYRSKNPTGSGASVSSFNVGKDRFLAGQYESAISMLSDYITNSRNGSNYYEALFLRGRCFHNTNRLTAALDDFQAVYSTPSINDFTNPALLEAGEVKYEQRDFNGSLALFQQLDNTAGRVQNRVQAKFGIAKNYQALGQYERAIQELNFIVNNNEVQVFTRTRAQIQIGYNYYDAKNPDKALEVFRAVEKDNKNESGAESQYMIIRILYDQKKYAEAIAGGKYIANNYSTFNEWKAKSFLWVAEANYSSGDVFQAKGVWESLVKEDRYPEIQAQARKRLSEVEAQGSNN